MSKGAEHEVSNSKQPQLVSTPVLLGNAVKSHYGRICPKNTEGILLNINTLKFKQVNLTNMLACLNKIPQNIFNCLRNLTMCHQHSSV